VLVPGHRWQQHVQHAGERNRGGPCRGLHPFNAINKFVVNGMCCFDWIPLEEEDYTEVAILENIRIH
jgi:hypothetical protein